MYIAQQLKEKNIAEYLIYMWQVEDLLRANELNADLITETIISRYTDISDEDRARLIAWYNGLIDMMREEGVVEKGHLQINNNVIISLTELHNNLINSTQFPFYHGAYYKALPFIVELRSKNSSGKQPELETAFEALYGMMLLRLQQKTVSTETERAVESISAWLSMLANYYDKSRKGELDNVSMG